MLWARFYTCPTEAELQAQRSLCLAQQPCLAQMMLKLQDGGEQLAQTGM